MTLAVYRAVRPQHKKKSVRQIFKGDLIKFCENFANFNLDLPQNSQSPLFKCKKLVINTTKCDLCLFLHKMCCKMVWKFCEIWKILWELTSRWANSVRFYLTVWDIACMKVITNRNVCVTGQLNVMLPYMWGSRHIFDVFISSWCHFPPSVLLATS